MKKLQRIPAMDEIKDEIDDAFDVSAQKALLKKFQFESCVAHASRIEVATADDDKVGLRLKVDKLWVRKDYPAATLDDIRYAAKLYINEYK